MIPIIIVIITYHAITTVIVGLRVLGTRTQNGDKRNNPRRYAGAASCGLVHIIIHLENGKLPREVVKNSEVDVSCIIYLVQMYTNSCTWFCLRRTMVQLFVTNYRHGR